MQRLESPVLVILSDHERKSLTNRTFNLDCPFMELSKPGETGLKGSGYVSQATDGRLSFKIYLQNPANIPPSDGPPGKLLFQEDCYRLFAKDSFGREWSGEWIIPQYELYWNQPSTVATGLCKEIRSTRQAAIKIEGMRLALQEDIRIPLNPKDNTWKFKSGGFSFVLRKEDIGLSVSLLSSQPSLMTDIDTRVLNTLQFIFARHLQVIYIEKVADDTETVVLRSIMENSSKSHFQPPVDQFWIKRRILKELFDSYFAYTSTQKEPDSLSIIVGWLLGASKRTLDEQALAVSVLVESLLVNEKRCNKKFCEYVLPSPIQEQMLCELRKYVYSWNGDARLKERADGAIKQFSNVRSLDMLMELVLKGAITEAEKDAWQELRNGVAHGKIFKPTSKGTQELFDLVLLVTVLFYKLVFLIIGYKGSYTNYAESDWPDISFNHTLERPHKE